jgi:lipopolysaccharide heptosyltransferase II
LPTIDAVRKIYPSAHITLLTTKIGREIVEGGNLVDEIWISGINEIKTFTGYLKLLKKTKKKQFDIAIASSDSSSMVALLFWQALIPVRIGFSNPKLSRFFNKRISFSTDISHSQLNLKVIKELDPQESASTSNIDVCIPLTEQEQVSRILNNVGVNIKNHFIVLHLGSSVPSRRWPMHKFVELVRFLLKYCSLSIVCVGCEQEKKLVNQLLSMLSEDEDIQRVINLAGNTNIKQLIYLISQATLFIGHSTGPLHIAYMVGTPTVSLWGASSLKVWGPPCDHNKHICIKADLDCLHCEQKICPKGTLECMESITSEMVVSAISNSGILENDRSYYATNR